MLDQGQRLDIVGVEEYTVPLTLLDSAVVVQEQPGSTVVGVGRAHSPKAAVGLELQKQDPIF